MRYGWTRIGVSFGCMATLVAGTYLVSAQDRQTQQEQQQQQRSATQSPGHASHAPVRLPPADGVMEIRAELPQEIRVGDSFTYEIHVRNVTDNLVLHDVTIAQQTPEGFQIESSQVSEAGAAQEGGAANQRNGAARQGPKDAQQREQHPQQQQQGEAKQDDASEDEAGQDAEKASQQAASPSEKEQAKEQDQQQKQARRKAQRKQRKQSRQAGNQSEWTISKLEPGEERTIQVTAASDQEGQFNACLTITKFTPAICLSTKFVKPELEIVKRGPEEVGLCEEIEFEYFVKNTGTGNLEKFTVQDELPEGLKTIEGEDSLAFEVDGLKEGEVRKFVATLRASEPGEYASRAVAVQPNGEKTRSKNVTTRVVSADLAVAIQGPDLAYVDRPITYTIRMTNHGDVPAQQAELQLNYPNTLQVVQISEVRDSNQSVAQNDSAESSNQEAELTLADTSSEQADERQQAQRTQEADDGPTRREAARPTMEARRWEIGSLEPGKTKEVRITVRSSEGGTIKQQAVVDFFCGEEKQDQQRIRSVASTQTEVVALPALLISVSDQQDPVAVGDELTYKVVVQNEGNAKDEQIGVKATLPEALEFIEGTGDTKVNAEGNTLTFEPVEVLNPGERATWNIRVKAAQEGDIRFKIDVTSEAMDKPATSEEPTRLFKGTKSKQSESNEDSEASKPQQPKESDSADE